MTPRRYTQKQIADIFAKAEASAASEPAEIRDAYVLGYVSAALGVKLARFEADLKAALA